MYDIYTKKIEKPFEGTGEEWLIVEGGAILAHGRSWDDPAVQEDSEPWRGPLQGHKIGERGKGWRKARGFAAENAQPWAADMVEYHK